MKETDTTSQFPLAISPKTFLYGNFLVLFSYLLLVFSVGLLFPHFSPFWPPAAVAVFAILIYGFAMAPGVFLGAFLGNAFFLHWSIPQALLIALGNTMGPLLGAGFLHRGKSPWKDFTTARDVYRFLGGMGVLGSGVTSIVGSLVMVKLSSENTGMSFVESWLAWWTSDSCSILMLSPAIFTWFFPENSRIHPSFSKRSDLLMGGAILALLLVGWAVYFFPGLPEMTSLGLTGMFLPFLVWVAMTMSQRKVFSFLGIILFLQFGATAMGYGPFAHLVKNPQDAMIGMELLGMMTGFAVILVNVLTLERRSVMEQLEHINRTLESRVEERTRDLDQKTRELSGQLLFRQLLLDSLPVPVFIVDPKGYFALSNQKLGELLGVAPPDLIGRSVDEFFDSGCFNLFSEDGASFSEDSELRREDITFCANGQKRTLIANRVSIQNPISGMIVSLQDISERVFLEQRIQEREQLFRLIVETLPLPMIISRKSDSVLLYANPSVGTLFQLDIQPWIGRPLLSFWEDPHDRDLFLDEVSQKGVVLDRESELRMPSGEKIWMSISGGFSHISEEDVLIVAFRDIHDARKRQMILHQEVRTDFLTGLGNRKDLQEALPLSIERAREGAYPLVVCILDLDDFKAVNDLFGHAAGDILLREMALRMKASLRAEDYIARLGGDEFVLILENLEPNEDLIGFLDRFRELIEMPVALPTGENVSIGLSLGLTIYTEGETDPDLLMRQADEALYRAKAEKGSRSSWWKIYSMAP